MTNLFSRKTVGALMVAFKREKTRFLFGVHETVSLTLDVFSVTAELKSFLPVWPSLQATQS